MPLKLLEAFVQIFADKSAFEKTVAGLPGQMKTAGTQAGAAYRQAFDQVTAKRAAGAGEGPGGVSGITVGGRGVLPGASIFSKEGQAASAATKLAADFQTKLKETAPIAATLSGSLSNAGASASRLAGSLRLVSPELASVSTGAISAVRGFAAFGPVGIAIGAAIATASAAFLPFILRANQALDATTKIAQLKSKGDFQGFSQIIEEAADSMIALGEAAKFAQDETSGFQGAARRLVGGLSVAKNVIAEFFGGGVKAAQEQAKRAGEEARGLFQVLEKPKLAAGALKEAAALTEKEANLAKGAATSIEEQAQATDLLVKAKRDQATADKELLAVEIKRLGIEKIRTPERGEEIDAKIADARRKQVNVDRALSIEEVQIQREAARARAEIRAQEQEAAGREQAFRRRRVEAIMSAARDIVEVEAQTNLSLAQAFRARGQLQEAATEQAIRAVREEADARRAAIGARLQGATGDERVQLERELTEVAQEETTKRLEIESQAVAKRVQLAAQERTERIGQAEQLFAIQRSLGDRRLGEELATQAKIAQAAKEGSAIQIAAIQRVAEIQGQIQQQARGVIQQALSVAQQQAQRLGLEGPTFVSQASLQRDLERQQARDAAVKARFETGQSVRSDELQGALGNQPFFEQFKGLGGQLGDVFKQAVTPLKEAFESTLGPAVTEQFTNLATQAKDSFVNLVAAVTPAFQGLEKLVSDTMDRIKTRVDEGNSNIVASITRMVEDNLTRALRDAERRA